MKLLKNILNKSREDRVKIITSIHLLSEIDELGNLKIEYSEEEVIKSFISELINLAEKNGNTLNDYVSIISILYKMKVTYPKFNKVYDDFLQIINNKGYLKEYKRERKSNGVYIALQTLSQFDTPSWDLIPDRYMWFSTCIALLGAPNNSKITFYLAKYYSWNLYCFAKPAIYYTKLLVNQGFYEEECTGYSFGDDNFKFHKFNIFMQLGDNYLKIKDGINAKKYYLIAKDMFEECPIDLDKKMKRANLFIKNQNK